MPTFVQILDFIGTFAFAISGIRLASAKRFDWFGAYVVGLATAIGGGTIRDVLLDVTRVDDRPHLPDLYGAGFAVGYLFRALAYPAQQYFFYFRQHRAGAVHCGRCGQEHSLGISFLGGNHYG